MMKRLYLLIGVALLFVSTAHAAYITDKLVAGLYPDAKLTDKPLKALNSGTPLEVVSRKNGFVKVRTSDGSVGWVESTYLTDEKPARSILLETQARLATLQKQFEKLKAATRDNTMDDEQQQQLADQIKLESEAALQGLQKENAAMREKMNEIAQILNVQLETAPAETQGLSSAGSLKGFLVNKWFWLVLGLVLVMGFIGGFVYMRHRVYQRFGTTMKF